MRRMLINDVQIIMILHQPVCVKQLSNQAPVWSGVYLQTDPSDGAFQMGRTGSFPLKQMQEMQLAPLKLRWIRWKALTWPALADLTLY